MAAQKIRVIIADDHALYLDGLKMLLTADKEMEILDTAENGKELIQKAATLKPDVIVTDLMMPGINGIEAIKKISETSVTPCIALSTFDTESLIIDALEAGAIGYILKNAQRGEIIDGIKTVNTFQPFYCRATTAIMMKILSNKRVHSNSNAPIFSGREIEIIKLIGKEVSSEEIGRNLFISKRTVDGIRAKILSKMNVKTTAGVLLYALDHNLLTREEIR